MNRFETCESCVFSRPAVVDFDSAGDPSPTPILECHRFPPALHALNDSTGLVMAWPQVGGGDWCGEYRRDPSRRRAAR